jgi:hypothetical protein
MLICPFCRVFPPPPPRWSSSFTYHSHDSILRVYVSLMPHIRAAPSDRVCWRSIPESESPWLGDLKWGGGGRVRLLLQWGGGGWGRVFQIFFGHFDAIMANSHRWIRSSDSGWGLTSRHLGRKWLLIMRTWENSGSVRLQVVANILRWGLQMIG